MVAVLPLKSGDMAPLRTKTRDSLEFSVNLSDKEERKRARRLRVERAIAAQDKDGPDASKIDDETTACSISQQQVRKRKPAMAPLLLFPEDQFNYT